MKTVTNTAGEPEPERLSRRANGIEALGIVVFILVLMWPIAFGGDILGGFSWISDAVHVLIALTFLFILFLSPRLHGDRFESWGLGNPVSLLRTLRAGPLRRRLALGGIVTVLFSCLTAMIFLHWPEVAKFFNLHKIGLATDPLRWHLSWPGRWAVLVSGALISVVFVGLLIRYDNFLPAARSALRISLPFLAIVFAGAWLHRGKAAFDELSPASWALGVFGYIFWGALQQILFSGYFGTRLRKAYPPDPSPKNTVPADRRFRIKLFLGMTFALAGCGALSLTILSLYGTPQLDLFVLSWIGAMLFIGGWAYGHYFCKDKRRLLVATLTGACFGVIHIDSYGLVFLTWGLGTVLAYVFMEDRKRNVVALGLIHGLLGSTLNSLFSDSESGALEIDYRVGPWNIEEPSWTALIIPLLCIAALICLIRRLWKHSST